MNDPFGLVCFVGLCALGLCMVATGGLAVYGLIRLLGG